MRAAIYCRVSTQEQQKGFSLAGQLDDCRAYCDRHGYRVVRILRDVTSGRTVERAGFQRLVSAALRSEFDVVVVWHRNRFSRDPDHKGVIGGLLREAGVRIEAIHTGPRDGTPYDRFQDRILDAVDELELEHIIDRFRLGRLQSAREGNWPMKAPFGYRHAEGTTRLEHHPDEAPRVRAMYAAVAGGAILRDVATGLGVQHTTVLERIRHPIYRGLTTYAGIPVPTPPIVTDALWHAANRVLDHRARRNGQRPSAAHAARYKPTLAAAAAPM